ncbi:MAG: RHS repeat-associated core domain-containing protein [Chloroflexota bacterium]
MNKQYKSLLAVFLLLAIAFLNFSHSSDVAAKEPVIITNQTESNTIVTVRKTYMVAGQAVAQSSYSRDATTAPDDELGRTNEALYFIYSDHLGGANTLVNASSGEQTNTRFLPFGGIRFGGEQLDDLTERGFTGHHENRNIGLTYMNARYYLPGIGRFASSDTIVPNPNDPQTFNRFSYGNNSPINMIDPSGHCGADVIHQAVGDEISTERNETLYNLCVDERDMLESAYGIDIYGEWFYREMLLFRDSLELLGQTFEVLGSVDGFAETVNIIQGYQFGRQTTAPLCAGRACHSGFLKRIVLTDLTFFTRQDFKQRDEFLVMETIIHEIVHAWDHQSGYALSDGLRQAVGGHIQFGTNCYIRCTKADPKYAATGGNVYDISGSNAQEDLAWAFSTLATDQAGFFSHNSSASNPYTYYIYGLFGSDPSTLINP